MKRLVLASIMAFSATFAFFTAPLSAAPAGATSPPGSGCTSGKILTLKPWYANIVDGSCNIEPFPSDEGKQTGYIWSIVLVIVEDIFQLAGYVALAFIIYGGFLYLTSSGSPEATKKALKTIIGAIVGLVIALASIAIVGYIAGGIK